MRPRAGLCVWVFRCLRHRLGIDALATGPDVVAVEVAHERLDAGVGQLDPLDAGSVGQDLREHVGGRRVAPGDIIGHVGPKGS